MYTYNIHVHATFHRLVTDRATCLMGLDILERETCMHKDEAQNVSISNTTNKQIIRTNPKGNASAGLSSTGGRCAKHGARGYTVARNKS